ncbi:MAG: hypothetical protein ACI4GA_02880 [Acutalibacteraceae bacterium]|nr:hypothetical protein [Oscillospiraceae bacterium]
MLSAEKMKEKEIRKICLSSGDISVNDRFKGVSFSSERDYDENLSGKTIICIGKADDDERIFCTDDNLCYFGVSDGWGVENGHLVALSKTFCLHFDKPMGIDDLENYIKNKPEVHGFISHMALSSKISAIKKVLSAVKTNE